MFVGLFVENTIAPVCLMPRSYSFDFRSGTFAFAFIFSLTPSHAPEFGSATGTRLNVSVTTRGDLSFDGRCSFEPRNQFLH